MIWIQQYKYKYPPILKTNSQDHKYQFKERTLLSLFTNELALSQFELFVVIDSMNDVCII